MSDDARFEDGREAPLNLGAADRDDLSVISALLQDAVFTVRDISWKPGQGRFALLLNRFRWEDAGRARHGAERVRSVLAIDSARSVESQGVTRDEPDTILSLLHIGFQPDDEPPGGTLLLTLAGDGALRVRVEALDLMLKDVTRPYMAPSGKQPDHGT